MEDLIDDKLLMAMYKDDPYVYANFQIGFFASYIVFDPVGINSVVRQ